MLDPEPEFPPRLPEDWDHWSAQQKEKFRRRVERQCRSEQARLDQVKAMVRSKQQAFWEECLGDRLPAMMESRPLTEQALGDADPKVRLGAIKLMDEFWKPTMADDRACRQLVLGDPDWEVRIAAAYCWGDRHEGTRNRAVAVTLASIAKDGACRLDFRCAAYIACHQVLGKELPFEILKALFTAKEHMPDDLDWSSIESFLPSSTGSRPSGVPVALRLLGLTFCLLGALLGAVFIWYGAWGLHFAATESPARDRPGDYLAAGLITAIGVIGTGFSARWGWLAFRWLRQRSFGRYNQTPARQTDAPLW